LTSIFSLKKENNLNSGKVHKDCQQSLASNTTAVPSFEPLIDTERAAQMLGGIHPKTLMKKARQGDIPGYQVSRSWFFRASELDCWLRTLIASTQANTPA
jgi:hypothetical protein